MNTIVFDRIGGCEMEAKVPVGGCMELFGEQSDGSENILVVLQELEDIGQDLGKMEGFLGNSWHFDKSTKRR